MKNRILWIINIVLFLLLAVRLFDQSQILTYFPLDYTNDISSYMSRIFFLNECGIHNFCPYWYGGFNSFESFSLGWSLFSLPLFWLFGSVQYAAYFSVLLMYAIGFVLISYLGKLEKFNNLEKFSFFLLFFANAIAIGDFIRLGRTVSMFGFVLMIGLFIILRIYSLRRIDNKFLLTGILYALILISHQQEMILSSFLLLGLLISKKDKKEILRILGVGVIGVLLSGFWLIPFLKSLFRTSMVENIQSRVLLTFETGLLNQVAYVVIPLISLFLFYYYYKYLENKKEILLFLPSIVLMVLFLFRLIPFIPILNNIYPDPYLTFFIFLDLFAFFKIRKYYFRDLMNMGLVLFVLGSVLISLFYTPWFLVPNEEQRDMSELIPKIDGRFFILSTPPGGYSSAYYSYAAINKKLSVGGWYHHLASRAYLDALGNVKSLFLESQCEEFTEKSKVLEIDEFLAYGEDCEKLEECGLEERFKTGNSCLYSHENR